MLTQYAAGIRPTSKKNRHLVLAIASGCTLVELSTLLDSSPFSRWPRDLEAFALYIHILLYFPVFTYCWML